MSDDNTTDRVAATGARTLEAIVEATALKHIAEVRRDVLTIQAEAFQEVMAIVSETNELRNAATTDDLGRAIAESFIQIMELTMNIGVSVVNDHKHRAGEVREEPSHPFPQEVRSETSSTKSLPESTVKALPAMASSTLTAAARPQRGRPQGAKDKKPRRRKKRTATENNVTG